MNNGNIELFSQSPAFYIVLLMEHAVHIHNLFPVANEITLATHLKLLDFLNIFLNPHCTDLIYLYLYFGNIHMI